MITILATNKKMPKKETEVPGTTPYLLSKRGWGFRIIR
jgi:hypothetical protein